MSSSALSLVNRLLGFSSGSGGRGVGQNQALVPDPLLEKCTFWEADCRSASQEISRRPIESEGSLPR